jgi:hypothetical protein
MKESKTQQKSVNKKLKKRLKRAFYERTRLALLHRYLQSLHSKNAVFIWIPKSAGTSVSTALGNHGFSKLKKLKYIKYYFPQKGMITFGHIHYPELIKHGYISEKFDQTAYKFCFSRNPYDRAVSLFFYLKTYDRVHVDMSFLEFCRHLNDEGCEDIGLYNLDGWSQCQPQVRWIENLKIDFIGKFESLEKDFNNILHDLSLPATELPHHNISSHKHYSRYYCKESKELIENFYRQDFLFFGYEFEDIV